MNWNDKDKCLFSIINQSGKYHLEKQIEDGSNIYFTLKNIPKYFIIFGYYNLEKNVFIWQNNMNNNFQEIVKREYINIFGSYSTLKKIFQNEVFFDKEYMNIIPYLMEALNQDYNVICIKSNNTYIYALTIIEKIRKTFNLGIFEEVLFYHYKNWNKNQRNKIKKQYRYTQKVIKNDVFECKETL